MSTGKGTIKSPSSEEIMKMEHDYAAHNYHPIPVVFEKASGVYVWDPEGKKYFDFLSAYSAVNQGHCHPRLVKVMIEQSSKLTLSSRAFYNSQLGPYAEYVTKFFGFDSVLPMNTGAEGVETALKLARRWGYMKKKIPPNKAIIVCCKENFHGRTISIITMSTDPDCQMNFGPFTPGFVSVDYDNADALEAVLNEQGDSICGFLVEPIQGEAGVRVPSDGYLKKCRDLCTKYNVLFIADEIQTGLARTGKMLCVEHDNVTPDILILGKALSGGMLPVSAVLANKSVMECFTPGSHGSTYGGNPLACAVAIEALKILKDERLADHSEKLGQKFRTAIRDIQKKCSFITTVRGRGLLNAIIIDPNFKLSAYQICLLLKQKGLLAKMTHKHIIRFAPPLVITEEQLDQCIAILDDVLTNAPSVDPTSIATH